MGTINQFTILERSPIIDNGILGIFQSRIYKKYKYRNYEILSTIIEDLKREFFYTDEYTVYDPMCRVWTNEQIKQNPILTREYNPQEIYYLQSSPGTYSNGFPTITFQSNGEDRVNRAYFFNLFNTNSWYSGTYYCQLIIDYDTQVEYTLYNIITEYQFKVNATSLRTLVDNYNPDKEKYIFIGIEFVDQNGNTVVSQYGNYFSYLALKAYKSSESVIEEGPIRSLDLLFHYKWLDENDNDLVSENKTSSTEVASTSDYIGATASYIRDNYSLSLSNYIKLVYTPISLTKPVQEIEYEEPKYECDANNPCPSGYQCVNGKCLKIDENLEKSESLDTSSYGIISYKSPSYFNNQDQFDILYLPVNVQLTDVNGTYIGDAPYNQVDGIVVSHDGIYYYPNVRITNVTNSFTEPDTMEFVQYTKFDANPYFREGQLVYGVIYGEVKFGGFIESITYEVDDNQQVIRYYATGFRKFFEEHPFVFNYTDYNISSKSVIIKAVNNAPKLYCLDMQGELPDFNLYKISLTNATVGDALSYIFRSSGNYAWYLGPNKIFTVYNLSSLAFVNIYVATEGSIIDPTKIYVIDMKVNYNLADRITRLIIRGDFKRDSEGAIITDNEGNPQYIEYDTGWVGTAYTQFNVQRIKTLIEDRFKYIEGQRDDTGDLKKFAELYIAPYKDAFIGGSCIVDGVKTQLSIGKSVIINGSNLSYLQNQKLIIQKVKYNLDNKTTELSLTANYWFGSDLTNYFASLEDRIEALAMSAAKETTESYGIAVGKVINSYYLAVKAEGFPPFWVIELQNTLSNELNYFYIVDTTQYQGYGSYRDIKPGHYIQIHYSVWRFSGGGLSFKYNVSKLIIRLG